MEAASILAIIILLIAVLILIYYYLQSTNNPLYQNIHSQASNISSRVVQEPYVIDLSDKVNDFGGKFKDRVKVDETEETISKTDMMTNKINQFIDEQSEQVIADWDLATHKDIDIVLEKYNNLEKDLNDYKDSNNKRVDELEQRLNDIDEKLNDIE
ncbi:MAG: hypothetical protein SOV21_07560 [Methanosphaera sp.]|nr:hypothetical protein [Methanosphaera sp.]